MDIKANMPNSLLEHTDLSSIMGKPILNEKREIIGYLIGVEDNQITGVITDETFKQNMVKDMERSQSVSVHFSPEMTPKDNTDRKGKFTLRGARIINSDQMQKVNDFWGQILDKKEK